MKTYNIIIKKINIPIERGTLTRDGIVAELFDDDTVHINMGLYKKSELEPIVIILQDNETYKEYELSDSYNHSEILEKVNSGITEIDDSEISIEKMLLEEIDDFLMYLEDFTKGEDGNTITKLRKKICYFLNS
jgi:hypothetical protein